MLTRSTDPLDLVGRRLEGRAYYYDHPSRVTDDGWLTSYYEEIARGADARTLSHHRAFPLTRLHSQHGGTQVGTVTFHRSEDERALMFRALVDRSPAGDELLSELDEWRDASVTFDPLGTVQRSSPYHGPIVRRTEIRLAELALSPVGTALAAGAEVLAVRSSIAPPAPTPKLNAARRRRQLMEARNA